MNKAFAIGTKAGKVEAIYVGDSEKAAFDAASGASGFDFVEVYINPVPFSVVSPKPAPVKKAVKKAAKKAVKAD